MQTPSVYYCRFHRSRVQRYGV